MSDKEKKEDSVGELGKKIDSLEEKFDNFLTNDFPHLASDVANLKSNGTTLINQNKATQRKLTTLEKNVLIILKNTTIDLGK